MQVGTNSLTQPRGFSLLVCEQGLDPALHQLNRSLDGESENQQKPKRIWKKYILLSSFIFFVFMPTVMVSFLLQSLFFLSRLKVKIFIVKLSDIKLWNLLDAVEHLNSRSKFLNMLEIVDVITS